MNEHNWVFKGHVVKVVDGDTIDVLVDMGFSIFHKTRLRLARVDTPELNSSDSAEREEAKIAKQWVIDYCLNKDIFFETTGKGKYGRYLAEIFTVDNTEKSINDLLLENGLAKLYT